MRKRATSIGGLILLCLIWAAASLRHDLFPGRDSTGAPTLLEQAFPPALVAAVTGAFALRRRLLPKGGQFANALMAGIGLFAVPAILLRLASGAMDDSTRVALFSLVPVFAVVLEPYLGSDNESSGGLAAALVAVCGTLIVFPFALPHAMRDGAAWGEVLAAVASIAAANCVAVRAVSRDETGSMAAFTFVATGSAAVILGLAGLLTEGTARAALHFDVWTIFEAIAVGLLFWLMRRMSAVKMTTRFLIAPLLANLIGMAVLRPRVDLRDAAGLLLIGLGAGWLLLAPKVEKTYPTELDLT
jgi:drug/metabolite transporter (DMT)-like permease